MGDYTVQRNVGKPVSGGKYPFGQMQPGDSFEFPMDERKKVSSAASQYGARNGQVFSTRKVDDLRGRCWRDK